MSMPQLDLKGLDLPSFLTPFQSCSAPSVAMTRTVAKSQLVWGTESQS